MSGDLGPVYGFQWRHSGAGYVNMHTNYTNQGVDQLAEIIHLIRNNPDSRRIIMCAWNPPGKFDNNPHITFVLITYKHFGYVYENYQLKYMIFVVIVSTATSQLPLVAFYLSYLSVMYVNLLNITESTIIFLNSVHSFSIGSFNGEYISNGYM